MRISSKSRYAINTMLELALNDSDKAIKLADISDKQGVSLSYLEQLFAALRAKGLVVGRRGPGGGYALGRDADKISISDIICAVDEWVEYSQQKLHSIDQAVYATPLTTKKLWDELSLQIFDFLADISLKDLISANSQQPAADHGKHDRNVFYTDQAA